MNLPIILAIKTGYYSEVFILFFIGSRMRNASLMRPTVSTDILAVI